MTTSETEDQQQRRLEREARTHCLGVIADDDATDTARVEATYQEPGDIERCGYLLVSVRVPTVDPADEDAWGANTPTQLATDRAHAWADARGFDYFSVDDVYAA